MELMANSRSPLSNDVRSSDLFGKNVQPHTSGVLPPADDDNSEIPSSYVESSTLILENGISSCSVETTEEAEDIVDSALLCAMRDAREKVALLRLEQAMVDFIKEETMGYIEVGGPGNCLVVNPSGKLIGKNSNNMDASGNFPPGRQTSFQRCWLHRLADRFGIVREINLDGMIRLVKVKESAIPKRLLIDLDPSEYAPVEEQSAEHADGRGLASKLSDSSIGKQKMKIMKRSSSGLGSSSSLKSEGKQSLSRNNNRRNLSDKEKAYAEARARIFNDGGGGSGGDSVSDAPVPDASEAAAAAAGEGSSSVATTQASPTPTPPAAPVDQSPDASSEVADKAAAVNKATWRNRRQEENDPDFQRLAGPAPTLHYHAGGDAAYIIQQTAPTTTGATPMYGYNPQTQHFYPSTQPFSSHAYEQQNAGVTTTSSTTAASASSNPYSGTVFYPAPHETDAPYNYVAQASQQQSSTSSPYYRGRPIRSLSRQSSLAAASSTGDEEHNDAAAANVNNWNDFPSL